MLDVSVTSNGAVIFVLEFAAPALFSRDMAEDESPPDASLLGSSCSIHSLHASVAAAKIALSAAFIVISAIKPSDAIRLYIAGRSIRPPRNIHRAGKHTEADGPGIFNTMPACSPWSPETGRISRTVRLRSCTDTITPVDCPATPGSRHSIAGGGNAPLLADN